MSSLFTAVVLAILSVSAQARSTIRKDDSNTLIVGGTEARLGQFPYQLQVFFATNFHYCGASLVEVQGIQVALTTANCVFDYPIFYFNLRAGVLDWLEYDEEEQWRFPYAVVRHPGFDRSSFQNDIAIMFIEEPFELHENVSTVSLPKKLEEVTAGTNVTVSGWGTEFQGGEYSNRLQYVEIPVVSNAQCNDSWVGDNGIGITESQLCAGDVNRIAGPCEGDSGDPAVDENGYLVGIASWAKVDCGDTDTHPSVYTKVSHFVDWIEVTVANYKNGLIKKNQ